MPRSVTFTLPQLRQFTPVTVALLAVLTATADALAQEKRPIRANDLYRIRSASDVTLSPDGRRVAFIVTQIDSAQNEYRSHIWLGEVGRRAVRPITSGAARDRDPNWSPDGSMLAFVSNRDGEEPQIYLLNLGGGEAQQITELENGASNPVWSPDSRKLFFTSSLSSHQLEDERVDDLVEPSSDDATSNSEAAMWGSMAAIRKWLEKNASEQEPAVITRLNFQGERSLNAIERWSHIYVIDLENGTPRRLTDGSFNFRNPAISPDGKQIAFTATIPDGIHPDFQRKTDLYIMAVDGSDRRMINIPNHSVRRAEWSPDGRYLAFTARDTIEITAANVELGLVELREAGVGEIRWLSRPLDRSVRGFAWAPGSDAIYFTAAVHGTVPIYRVRLREDDVRQLVSGERGVLSFDVAAKRLAYAVTAPGNPSEIYVANEDGSDERRMSEINSEWSASIQLQPHRGFWYRSFDGRRIQGWLIEPVGYRGGEKYPLAVEIHGGPHAMWGPGERTMWHEFQLLAANGYFVLYTNPRGSDGYGYEFKYAIQRAWGEGPMRDVLTAVDSAVASGAIDAERMVVTGGSYAGYLTAYLIGHDHRFKAAVAQRGVYDLGVFFGEGNAWRLVPAEFNAYPWEDPEIIRAESPITYAHQIQTPLLIMHADRDLRTGVSGSEMLYRTLKVLKRPVEYVRYPREGHDLSRTGEPSLRIDRLLRILEFFDRHVGEGSKR